MDVDRSFARLSLIMLCAGLSDEAKVTLSVMYTHLLLHRQFPRIADLARTRGVNERTIRYHLTEATAHGAMTRVKNGAGYRYDFQWNVMAKSVGWSSERTLKLEKAVGAPRPKGSDEHEIRSRVQTPKDSKTLLHYFRALYREKIGKPLVTKRVDQNRMRTMIQRYGMDAAIRMVEYYARHRKRLLLPGPFSVETLFSNHKKIHSMLPHK